MRSDRGMYITFLPLQGIRHPGGGVFGCVFDGGSGQSWQSAAVKAAQHEVRTAWAVALLVCQHCVSNRGDHQLLKHFLYT